MIRQRQHVLIALTAALALTGCGSKASMMMSPSVPVTLGSTQAASVITVTQSQTQLTKGISIISGNASNVAPAPIQHASSIAETAEVSMSEDEAAADAQSAGYSVQDLSNSIAGSNFSNDGTVRQTASGYALEVTSGFIHKKTTSYALDGSSAVMSQVAAQLNNKVDIKGILDANTDTIEVSSVKHDISLGFLTNWLTRGKISGVVKDAYGGVIAGAHVVVTTSQGFQFSQTTGPDGSFAIKNLEPGAYTVEIDDAGYLGAIGNFTVHAMRNAKVQGLMVVDTSAASPVPSLSPSVDPRATASPAASGTPDASVSPAPVATST